ncbi:hypothetical protein EXS57_02250 [Candidatus Kaiserbacteria bacterium]|nr:hypothetical protein [Candidatus Kaiserbacteria bacterium]
MSLFGNLFNKKNIESVVLIDIGIDSVAGAYARYEEGKQPTILYSRRLPIEMRHSEPKGQAMMRALKVLGTDLLREGAPTLVRVSGSGTVHTVLVSINAPWQKTALRTEHFEQVIPFVFNKHMLLSALEKKDTTAPLDHTLVDESVISTILNGYETSNPYGKEVHRAAVSILMSYVDTSIIKEVQEFLHGLYHTKKIICLAGSSLRYQALRAVFPHERDVLILDTMGPPVTALVRGGVLVEIVESSGHITRSASWLKEITTEFSKIAERFPLPRAIFLLAYEQEASARKEILAAAHFEKLWLSDNPPKIIPVLGSHMSELVRQTATVSLDSPLSLMALYYRVQRYTQH